MKKNENDVVSQMAKKFEPRSNPSVRTTFKISKEAMECLEFICEDQDLSVKQALEDVVNLFSNSIKDNPSLGHQVLDEVIKAPLFNGVRKTYVVSKNTLITLKLFQEWDQAKDREMDQERDRVLDYLIKNYRKVIEHKKIELIDRNKRIVSVVSEMAKLYKALSESDREYIATMDDNDTVEYRLAHSLYTCFEMQILPIFESIGVEDE